MKGQLIDLHQRRTYPAEILVEGGIITAINELSEAPAQYILPGFVDAHVHIESSMLVPTAFARMAVLHGTVATVSDPHEIANVCGVEGVQYMIDNAAKTPFKIFFGAPSCVPATAFETAGATLDAIAVNALLASPDIWYLTEVMNYPGVLHQDAEVMAKVAAAKRHKKPVDGHAPGLRGAVAAQYAAAGITTDHECVTLGEALDKVAAGMHILIREGSAAKNFEALHPLFLKHPERIMLCSDDKHPDDLVTGHINKLVQRALAKGYNLYDVLRAASVHPVQHYGLPVGLLRVGDLADFLVVDDLAALHILQVFIDGHLVAEEGMTLLPILPAPPINRFVAGPIAADSLEVATPPGLVNIRVIEAMPEQLITRGLLLPAKITAGNIVTDVTADVLKIVVINRYEQQAAPAIAFIKGFGLQHGAIASTVAHDCHNIIAVGVDDASITAAINILITAKGGIAVAEDSHQLSHMALPIAGLMTDADGPDVARAYSALDKAAKALGSLLDAPFMTLSFMALLVIPALKLSDKGLFDGAAFRFVDLAVPSASPL